MALGRAIDKQQAEIARMERFVERFRTRRRRRARPSRAQKKLDKIERIERDPRDERSLGFQFKPPERSGRVIFELEGGRARGRSAARVLLDDAEIWLERGEHVSLVGPNGDGQDDADRGARRPAARSTAASSARGHNVKLGYLSQHADELGSGRRAHRARGARRSTPG